MNKTNKICSICGEPHHAKELCKRCYTKKYQKQIDKRYYDKNYDKIRIRHKEYYSENRHRLIEECRQQNYKRGAKPMSENKECASYLGVYIAERILSKIFKNVERMSYHNPGYDFICNKGNKIDVKSSAMLSYGRSKGMWSFKINYNRIADYFLCLAFDNRTDLNPLHIWLIPAKDINYLRHASISKSTISKWNKYKRDIDVVKDCCDSIRS